MNTTWILIASSTNARLFKTTNHSKKMTLLKEFHHPESREKISELIVNSRGRYRSENSIPGGMFEDHTSPRRVEVERFARELVEKLDEGRRNNYYNQLVIIAPAQFHGLLNKFYNPHVKNLVLTTMHKDYTKLSEYQLPRYLNGRLHLKKAA